MLGILITMINIGVTNMILESTIEYTLDVLDIDIALLTEHKLLPHMTYFMDSIHLNYYNHTMCDSSFDVYGSVKCGKAGVSIFYKKNLMFAIRTLDEIQDEKICGIEFTLRNTSKLYLLCTYMPASNYSNIEYTNVLNTLQAAIDTYSEQGIVVLAGDMNAEISLIASNGQTFRDKSLSQFAADNSLYSVGLHTNTTGSVFTFKTAEKMIDHILIHKYNEDLITQTKIIEDDIFGVSDHLPIFTSINVEFESVSEPSNSDKIAWHKINDYFTEQYQNNLSIALQTMDNKDIDSFYNKILSIIKQSADETLPKTKFNKHAKPYWGETVKTTHRNQRNARKRWIAQGKPRGNNFESYTEYKLLKRKFINIQKKAIQNTEFLRRIGKKRRMRQ